MGKKSGCGSQQFPASYRALPPSKKRAWLVGEECGQFVTAGRLSKSQVLSEVSALLKRRQRVSQIAPSPAMVDDYDAGHPFPPRAEHTPMRQARRMLNPVEEPVYWPAHYLDDADATYDVLVFEDEQRRRSLDLETFSGRSHSAVVFQELEERGLVLTEQKLEPDSREALQGEIDRFLAANERPTTITV